MKILLVEDELELQALLREQLEREQFVVESASTYREAKERIALYSYDCILLDLGLPGGDGLNLLREMKEQGQRGNVLIISARGTVDDKIMGLELGADDYLAKPFHTAELLARVRSIIRRSHRGGASDIVVGNVRIVPEEFAAYIGDEPMELSRKEYDILHYLLLRKGRLINKQMMAETVWGDYIDQADNFDFIYAHIKNLRKKMNALGASIQIKAVYGVGYKLIEI